LNRAEWIKFLGLFFNLDSTATQIFDSINSSYAQTKAGVKTAAKPPVLAFVDLYSYPPDTAFEVSLAAYKTQYTKVCFFDLFSILPLFLPPDSPLLAPLGSLQDPLHQGLSSISPLFFSRLQDPAHQGPFLWPVEHPAPV